MRRYSSRVDQGFTPLIPQQNRTCAIYAYGSSLSIPTSAIKYTQFCMPSRCCSVCQPDSAPYSQLSSLYSHSLTDSAKCTPLPSTCFHKLLRYYECIGLPASLLGSCRVSLVWFPYPLGRMQDLSCSVRNRCQRPRQALRPGDAATPSPYRSSQCSLLSA